MYDKAAIITKVSSSLITFTVGKVIGKTVSLSGKIIGSMGGLMIGGVKGVYTKNITKVALEYNKLGQLYGQHSGEVLFDKIKK